MKKRTFMQPFNLVFLAIVFSASFLTVFLAIFFFSQSAHSTPSNYIWEVNGMDITVGPPPNSTNIPLDTTITIDALASAALNDLQITPETSIAYIGSEVSGPLTYLNTFYPAQPLKPATSYTVSVTIMNVPVSWSFTTTSQLFQPEIGFYLATNVLWISLLVATFLTSIVSIAIWLKRK